MLRPQLDDQKKEEARDNAPQPLSDKDGDEERRRELAEEGMAQAGQPQTLEEDLDQQQQEEEEEESEAEQPDENALEQEREQVRTVFFFSSELQFRPSSVIRFISLQKPGSPRGPAPRGGPATAAASAATAATTAAAP